MMKTYFLKTMTCAVLLALTACSDDDSDAAAVLSLASESVTLSARRNDTATCGIASNDAKLRAFVTEGADWMSAEISGSTVTITATKNNGDDRNREGTVKITAGAGSRMTVQALSVIQTYLPVAKLTFNPGSLTLPGAADASGSVTVALGADAVSFTATMPEEIDWLSHTVSGNTVSFKALTDNITSKARSAAVVFEVAAGPGVLDGQQTFTVTQERASYPDVGDVYSKDGINGVIFWVDENDATQAKIVSAKAYHKALAWCESNVNYTIDGVTNTLNTFACGLVKGVDKVDGEENVKIIRQWIATHQSANPELRLEKFYQVYHCDTLDQTILGGSAERRWYQPAYDELMALAFDAYLGYNFDDPALAAATVVANNAKGWQTIVDAGPDGPNGQYYQTAVNLLKNRKAFEDALLSLPEAKPLNSLYNGTTAEGGSTTYFTSSQGNSSVSTCANAKVGTRSASPNGHAKTDSSRWVRCIMKVTLDPVP